MNETSIRYNGVVIRNVLTQSIDQTVQLDATNTDPIYVRTTATFTGMIHTQTPLFADDYPIGIDGTIYGSAYQGNVGPAFQRMLYLLNQPRRPFAMWIGDQLVYAVWPGHTEPHVVNPNLNDRLAIENTDVNHGPLPSYRVLSVVSAYAIRIEFQIVMHIPFCDTTNSQIPHGITSFRFWMAENINCNNWTTTRVYHGRVRVRHAGHNVLAEFKKHFWCPALQRGFIRRRIALNQSTNGLELDFTIEDEEVWAVPPPPATKWSGRDEVEAVGAGMVYLTRTYSMDLDAPKTVPKRYLMWLAQTICDKKLHLQDSLVDGKCFIDHARFVDQIADNRVSISYTVKYMDPGYYIPNFCLPLDENDPLLGDYGYGEYNNSVAYLTDPTASLKGMFLAYLNDPLHVRGWPVEVVEGGGFAPTPAPGGGSQNGQGGDAANPVPAPGVDPAEIAKGMYTVYVATSDLDIDRGVIVLPFANGSASATVGPISAALYMNNGFATRTITIQAERLGEWPTLPQPITFTDASGILHWLLSDHPHMSLPQISADFRKTLYRTDYVLRYALQRIPDWSKSEYRAGHLPYRSEQGPGANVFWIPAANFVDPKTLF